MNKFVKRLIIFLLISATLLFAVLPLVSHFYGDKITKYIVNEISKSLKGEITYTNAEFTLIEKFPYASIKFSNVVALSSKNFSRKDLRMNSDTALAASEVFIQFNIYNLIRKEYNMHKITVEDATINILFDNNGEFNLDYFETDRTQDSSSVRFEIRSLQITNVKARYADSKSGMLIQTLFDDLQLSGNFTQKDFKLKSKAELYCYQIRKNNEVFINDKYIVYSAEIDVLNSDFYIKQLEIEQDDISFLIEGNILKKENDYNVDIKLEGKDTQIPKLLSLLPAETNSKISKYAPKGEITFSAKMTGAFSKKHMPSLEVNYKVEGGTFLLNSNEIKYSSTGDLYCKYLDNLRTYILKSSNTAARYNNSLIKGNFVLSNFEKLSLKTNIQASVSLDEIVRLFDENKSYSLAGTIEGSVAFRGDLSLITADNYDSYISESSLKLKDIGYIDSSDDFNSIRNVNGNISIKNSVLYLENTSFLNNNTKFRVNGEAKNIAGYFSKSKGELSIHADIKTDTLIYDNFVSKKAGSDTVYIFPDSLFYIGNIQIGTFVYDKLVVKNIQTKTYLEEKRLVLENLTCNALEGDLSGTFFLEQIPGFRYSLKGNTKVSKMSLPGLFTTFDNFDLEAIKSQNIKGTLDGTITFSILFNYKFDVINKSLIAQTDATISNGELLNFEPALELSKFVSVSELQKITFSTLKNSFFIRNDSLYIPPMQINSNAFNVTIEGIQDFKSNFDYRIEVLLNEILSKKRKTRIPSEEFGEIEDDGLGRTKLFLRILGNSETFDISWDKKRSSTIRQEKLQEEKKELMQIFKDEFKIKSKDSTQINQNKKDDVPAPREDFEYDFDDI